MKKKVIALALSLVMATGLFVGCGDESGEKGQEKMKIGMVTDAGTIDDKSFNQGTWEGIKEAEEKLKIESRYLQPAGTTHGDYMKEINNLYDAGFKFMVTPGFKFETAIYEAQNKYEDANFVLIDGEPRENQDADASIGKNTVSIYYAEHEAGFLAGVATAKELKEGELGFIGGLAIPPVQRFNWGFQQGVKYANEKLGTKMSLKKENVIYQGSFDKVEAGKQIAAQMYDRGVKAIFTAAGGVGIGAINEAKERATNGEQVWVIGVDVDQYTDGIYKDQKSVVLTSATKSIKKSVYDMIELAKGGGFEGGKVLLYDAKNDGIGLPEKNPNLSAETLSAVAEALKGMKEDTIKVSSEQGDLIK